MQSQNVPAPPNLSRNSQIKVIFGRAYKEQSLENNNNNKSHILG